MTYKLMYIYKCKKIHIVRMYICIYVVRRYKILSTNIQFD